MASRRPGPARSRHLCTDRQAPRHAALPQLPCKPGPAAAPGSKGSLRPAPFIPRPQAHQLDEVVGHRNVVVVDGVHDRVDEHVLVLLAQLGHVAKVDVRNAAVAQREDVAGVRVAVEQAKLRRTGQAFTCWAHVQAQARVQEPDWACIGMCEQTQAEPRRTGQFSNQHMRAHAVQMAGRTKRAQLLAASASDRPAAARQAAVRAGAQRISRGSALPPCLSASLCTLPAMQAPPSPPGAVGQDALDGHTSAGIQACPTRRQQAQRASSSCRRPDTTPQRMNSSTLRPDARMPAGSVQRRPSIHSIVSMRPPLRSRRTQGIFTLGSPLKFLPKSCARTAQVKVSDR